MPKVMTSTSYSYYKYTKIWYEFEKFATNFLYTIFPTIFYKISGAIHGDTFT